MSDFLQAARSRTLIADGAMGTMLQAAGPTLEDFQGHDGCNEILNVTRPDIVGAVHTAYFAAGADAVETNTFGCNASNLGEYGIADRIEELAFAGTAIARACADAAGPGRFVLGSVGPGTKLPSLGHTQFAIVRDAAAAQVRGMVAAGCDAVLIETVQDPLQAKAAVIGARRGMRAAGVEVPVLVSLTVETTGTMLVGSDVMAAAAGLVPLGIDGIGLNCATGPAEMAEHIRTLSRMVPSSTLLTCLPNAGLPVVTAQGARYPLAPEELAGAHAEFVERYGVGLIGGCCGTTPEHIAALARAVGRAIPAAAPQREPVAGGSAVSSLYQYVPLEQESSVFVIGERTNANGSKAFRTAMVEGRIDDCLAVARSQTAEGCHALDLCVDYVGRDGVADMADLAQALNTASTLPLVLDSTDPAVLRAGLERTAGRSVVNSLNFEDGDGPESRFAQTLALVREHGAAVIALTIDEEGQARTAEAKVALAERLIGAITAAGVAEGDILVDCLTFPITTGQDETRRDGIETIAAIAELRRRHPAVRTVLGVSNVSFGLRPAARQVLNSVFLHECREAGLSAAIMHAGRIVPLARIEPELREVALDLVYDRRREGYDPLQRFMELTAGQTTTRAARVDRLAALPVADRVRQRIIDGLEPGLAADIDLCLGEMDALALLNDVLLDAMKTVGARFADGSMQLPFVLQSAEVMKAAVAHLEPHLAALGAGAAGGARGTIVLATVKGDVHDIGKNLVDIILSNNGYRVVNLGIKQPLQAILEAADREGADAIGMSGLLVKSTQIMRENLLDMNRRGVAGRYPVILGGAALTRAFVEEDLLAEFEGDVRYARDAFEGLNLMRDLESARRDGVPVGTAWPAPRGRRVRRTNAGVGGPVDGVGPGSGAASPARVPAVDAVPRPPFWGSRVVRGISTGDILRYLDERALFKGQWGLKPGPGQNYESLVEEVARPRLRELLDRASTGRWYEPAVVYGYWPAWSEGDRVVVLPPDAGERAAAGDVDWAAVRERAVQVFEFPRQQRAEGLCLADFVRPRALVEATGHPDVVAFSLVTIGGRATEEAAALFAANRYREYVEAHGVSVQLAEALAEYWHARIRGELGIADADAPDVTDILKQRYRGERFSIGYPACPDLEQRRQIAALLEPARIGVSLSEELQLHPEQSTDAVIFHHPQARYFNAR